MTPRRITAVKRIARRSYVSFSRTVVKLQSGKIIHSLSTIIRSEFKQICSLAHSAILRGDPDTIENFTWDYIWDAIQDHAPTLVLLLRSIAPPNSKSLICTIASMLVKKRHQRMGLLQKVISTFLYAHGAHKQVVIIL